MLQFRRISSTTSGPLRSLVVAPKFFHPFDLLSDVVPVLKRRSRLFGEFCKNCFKVAQTADRHARSAVAPRDILSSATHKNCLPNALERHSPSMPFARQEVVGSGKGAAHAGTFSEQFLDPVEISAQLGILLCRGIGPLIGPVVIHNLDPPWGMRVVIKINLADIRAYQDLQVGANRSGRSVERSGQLQLAYFYRPGVDVCIQA